MPPWPPSSCPVSLTPMSRLSIDSNRSPAGAAAAITSAEQQRLADREVRVRGRGRATTKRDEDAGDCCRRRSPRASCPGESAGASLCRPRARPPTYANVSSAKTASSSVNAASRPCSGMSRRSRTKPRPKPIQAGPSSVVATLTVAEPLVPASPLSRNASPSEPSRAPSAQVDRADLDRRTGSRSGPRARRSRSAAAASSSRRTRAARRSPADEHEQRTATSGRARRSRARAAARWRRRAGARPGSPSTTARRRGRGAGSRTGWRLDRSPAAEAAAAARVLVERVLEVARAEVGPELVDEDELGVGELPEQEVRDAQLAGGADEQVGVGQLGRVEVGGERRSRRSRRGSTPLSTSRRAASTISARPP